MHRRSLCGVVLALLVLPELLAGVRAFAEAPAAVCACSPRECRCAHHHGGTTRPHCHFPGGKPAPSGPAFARCDRDTSPAAPAQLFLLPEPGAVSPPVVQQSLPIADSIGISSFFQEPLSPPPRPSSR